MAAVSLYLRRTLYLLIIRQAPLSAPKPERRLSADAVSYVEINYTSGDTEVTTRECSKEESTIGIASLATIDKTTNTEEGNRGFGRSTWPVH